MGETRTAYTSVRKHLHITKVDQMGKKCSMHTGKEKYIQNFYLKTPVGFTHAVI
jgi:hypothetical protein